MSEQEWPDWQVYVDRKCLCVYCGYDGRTSIFAWWQLVIDHVIPRARGGPDAPENKVVACRKCNDVKAGWDKLFDPGKLASKSKNELVKSAKEYISDYYRRWNPDFQTMMNEM